MNKKDHYLREHFEEIKDALAREYDIGSAPFKAWIQPLSYEGIEEVSDDGESIACVCIGVPGSLQEMLHYIDEEYHDLFLVFLSERLEETVEVRFTVTEIQSVSSYNNGDTLSGRDTDLLSENEEFFSNQIRPSKFGESFNRTNTVIITKAAYEELLLRAAAIEDININKLITEIRKLETEGVTTFEQGINAGLYAAIGIVKSQIRPSKSGGPFNG